MVTDLTNSDNAGTVVSRINTAIEEQNKGVSQLGADPNAGTVISRVSAAIDAESNDQLEDVTSSDNAVDFIGKVNDLFASIRNGGGGGDEPTPDPDYVPTDADYAYWNGANYVAFGDSITHTGSWAGGPALDTRYCYRVAQALGMTLSNRGVSGMTMIDNGTYSYPITLGAHVEGVHRSFARELFGSISDLVQGSNYEYRGPLGVTLTNYKLITLMLGSNDRQQIYSGEGQTPGVIGTWNDTQQETLILNNFYNAYYKAVKHIVEVIQNTDTVLVLCIPPKATGAGFRLVGDMKEPIMSIAEYFHLPIVNFYDLTGENETVELKNDGYGVHPTAEGHRVLGNYLKLRLGQIVHELNLRNA